MPVAYFPSISYFACLSSGRHFILETGETFPRQTIRNRCEIMGGQGKEILVVPVGKPYGNRTLTSQVVISGHENWQKRHWRALQTAYSSSPFFLYFADQIREFFNTPVTSLVELDVLSIRLVLTLTGITASLEVRPSFTREDPHGLNFRQAFARNNKSLAGHLPPYHQVFSEPLGFMENLSVLDLLFNTGPEAKSYLERSWEVISGSVG